MSCITYEVKVYDNGTKYWYLNGKQHREDGPAVEGSDGHKEWRLNGELHRADGPASEWSDGSGFWYLNGKLHREDGPAYEWANGGKQWWVNGVELTEAEFNARNSNCEGKVVEVDGVEYELKVKQ